MMSPAPPMLMTLPMPRPPSGPPLPIPLLPRRPRVLPPPTLPLRRISVLPWVLITGLISTPPLLPPLMLPVRPPALPPQPPCAAAVPMSRPVADGTGYGLARTIRKALKDRPSLNLIPSFEEPQAKGDLSVRPAGALTPGDGTITPNASFMLVEEQAELRISVASGDDDPDPISLLGVVSVVSRAVLLAGYTNFEFEFNALAQEQSSEKLTYTAGAVVAAMVSAGL